MKLIRKGQIQESEAKVLLDAIKEKGELVFPLNPGEIIAVKEILRKAQSQGSAYRPSLWEKMKAKWNYSYASVASFGLWLGAINVVVEDAISKNGKSALKLTLRSNNQIEWDALKAGAFRAPLI